MKKIGVIGAGSWGTALAITLSNKGHQVVIWDLDQKHLAALTNDRENKRYLPGVGFGENLNTVPTVEEALKDADVALFSVPAQHFRSAFTGALPYLSDSTLIVNVAKGIEQKSLQRMSEIAFDIKPDAKYVVLSGPSHAEEVCKAMPTTVCVVSRDKKLAEEAQDIFMTERFRVYTGDDIIGTELGGSLKNIIALGAGISDGMGFGDNAKAALMTRGLAEITRLGVALGADPMTFLGLTGVGDLIVTCTSMHSRNRRCGIMIGEGTDPKEATEKVGMVVEGYFTTEAAYGLAQKTGVEMPITEAMYDLINGNIGAREAEEMLMGRDRKHEEDKKFHIQTMGCQMNERDSETLAGMLTGLGYSKTENRQEADVAIINTCSVRDNADKRFFGTLGQLKKIKEQRPDFVVCVCGCMMQQQHIIDRIKAKYPWVDIIFGTHNIHEFPQLLKSVTEEKQKIVDVWDEAGDIIEGMPSKRLYKFKAFVNIMYGCNNFCTYCIVPYTRGRERSRHPEDIMAEVADLVSDGVREITLLGQNVNSYKGMGENGQADFADLIYMLQEVDGLERIRFMTSHPKDLSDKLIQAYRDCSKLCRNIHLPVQSGSDDVLKRMNRHYDRKNIWNLWKNCAEQCRIYRSRRIS